MRFFYNSDLPHSDNKVHPQGSLIKHHYTAHSLKINVVKKNKIKEITQYDFI